MVRDRSDHQDAVRITTAAESRNADIALRQRRYVLSMSLRSLCFVGAIIASLAGIAPTKHTDRRLMEHVHAGASRCRRWALSRGGDRSRVLMIAPIPGPCSHSTSAPLGPRLRGMSNRTYRVTEIVGTSPGKGIEEAISNSIEGPPRP